jgi:hypothetical protein
MIRAGVVAGLTEWKNRKNSGMGDAVAQSLADATIAHFASQLGAVAPSIRRIRKALCAYLVATRHARVEGISGNVDT